MATRAELQTAATYTTDDEIDKVLIWKDPLDEMIGSLQDDTHMEWKRRVEAFDVDNDMKQIK